MNEEELRKDIPVIISTHAAVKCALESARMAKALGSSLQSSVIISVPEGDVAAVLRKHVAELDSMFVVSSVDINVAVPEAPWVYEETFGVNGVQGKAYVLPPKQHKCGRCWRYLAEKEDSLCVRCDEVVQNM